jgi:Fe(3+) dicitrate transport protein
MMPARLLRTLAIDVPIALVLSSFALSAAAGQSGTVRGVVRVAATGQPIDGAVVRLAELDHTTTSDSRGSFEIQSVPLGRYTLIVRHDPLETATRTVTLRSHAVELDIELRVPPVREEITVTAIDMRDVLPGGRERTPGAASTLTADEIGRYRPYTLHEALDLIPGIRTIDDDVLGRRSGIGVRGAPPRRSRRVLLLEDGVPINAATYLDPSAHYTPPVERLERIDVLRGAGQLVHGPLNNHGIVNFHTLRATTVPETVADGGLGSQGTIRRHLLHRRTAGAVGLVAGYTGMNADGAFDTERHQFDDVFGSLEWKIGARHDLSSSVTYLRERSRYDERNLTLEEYAAHPRSKRQLGNGAEFNNIAVDYHKGHLTHRAAVSGRVTIASHVFFTHLDRPRFESRRGGPEAAGGYMRGRERRYITFGGASRVELATLATGATRHRVEAGVRWERQLFDNRNTVGRVGDVLGGSRRGTLAVGDGREFREDGRREALDAWAVSGYFQDAIEMGPVTVTPGVRVERYTQHRTLEFVPNLLAPESESDGRTLILPGISVLYDGLPATQIYAGMHRGYSPAIARTEDFPLLPETGVDAQLGVRSRHLRGLTIELGAFSNRVRNTIVKRTFTDALGHNVFVNSGDSRMRGIDVSGRLESQPLTGSRLNAFVQTAYGYTRALFTAFPIAGRRVPEVPLHSGSLTAGLEHLAGWHASATVTHLGSFFTDEANTRLLATPNPNEPLEIVGLVPRRTLLSARLTHRIAATPITIWVQGRNLTDALYISDVQDGLRPGAGRTVSAGVRIVF